MENGRQLQVGLYRRFVGDVVHLEILRDGQSMKVPVAMTERADDPLWRAHGAIRASTSCRVSASSAST